MWRYRWFSRRYRQSCCAIVYQSYGTVAMGAHSPATYATFGLSCDVAYAKYHVWCLIMVVSRLHPWAWHRHAMICVPQHGYGVATRCMSRLTTPIGTLYMSWYSMMLSESGAVSIQLYVCISLSLSLSLYIYIYICINTIIIKFIIIIIRSWQRGRDKRAQH